jgi:transcriptional antiterminator RfaH
VDEPLFARYLFIELSGTDAKWSVLRSTRGVTQVVQFGGVPAKMPAHWMDAFRSCERAPVRLFEPGQRVRVTDGPFAGLEGIYELPEGKARAIVLLELLGKPCKGTFAVGALRRAA